MSLTFTKGTRPITLLRVWLTSEANAVGFPNPIEHDGGEAVKILVTSAFGQVTPMDSLVPVDVCRDPRQPDLLGKPT